MKIIVSYILILIQTNNSMKEATLKAKKLRKWEYWVIFYPVPGYDFELTLNEEGMDGWELVMIHKGYLIFKREVL